MLRIASDLSLPPDTVTSTIVVYGAKGMGKTNFGAVLAEELSAQGKRFCYLDPVGVAWGMRHGRGALKVLALGGLHGDIPIEPTAGAVVADLVADEDVDVLIDISRHSNGKSWSKGDKTRFVADYMTRLYERQGEKRRPLMQIIDEAGRFVPQQIPHGAVDIAKCSGAIEEVVELGRNVGIGVCLITQRSARMAKSVSELAECMIAFRTIGPNSVGAIVDWFGDHVAKDKWKALVGELRSLPKGAALVVSPGWLEYEGVAHIRMRRTFDSSSTPKGRSRTRGPGRASTPDLKQYRARMLDTIEKSKADNPAALRKEIDRLKKELSTKQSALFDHKISLANKVREKIRTVKVPLMTKQERATLARVAALSAQQTALLARLASTSSQQAGKVDRLLATLGKRLDAIEPLDTAPKPKHDKPIPIKANWPPRPHAEPIGNGNGHGDLQIVDGMRKILATIKQLGPSNRARFGLTLAINAKGTTITAYLQRLTRAGLIAKESNGDRYFLTAAGEAQTVDVEPIPTTRRELLAHWRGRLVEGQRKILDYLERRDSVTRDELGTVLGINGKGTTITAYLQRMARLGVITKHGNGEYTLSEMFNA